MSLRPAVCHLTSRIVYWPPTKGRIKDRPLRLKPPPRNGRIRQGEPPARRPGANRTDPAFVGRLTDSTERRPKRGAAAHGRRGKVDPPTDTGRIKGSRPSSVGRNPRNPRGRSREGRRERISRSPKVDCKPASPTPPWHELKLIPAGGVRPLGASAASDPMPATTRGSAARAPRAGSQSPSTWGDDPRGDGSASFPAGRRRGGARLHARAERGWPGGLRLGRGRRARTLKTPDTLQLAIARLHAGRPNIRWVTS